MSFFDEVKNKAAGMLGGLKGEHLGILETIMGMVTNKESGGLGGLVDSFKEKGLGDIMSSWISTGKNLPISPEQVEEGIGQERVNQFATEAGMSPEAAKSKLAELLPGVVDKLTPQGHLPEVTSTEK